MNSTVTNTTPIKSKRQPKRPISSSARINKDNTDCYKKRKISKPKRPVTTFNTSNTTTTNNESSISTQLETVRNNENITDTGNTINTEKYFDINNLQAKPISFTNFIKFKQYIYYVFSKTDHKMTLMQSINLLNFIIDDKCPLLPYTQPRMQILHLPTILQTYILVQKPSYHELAALHDNDINARKNLPSFETNPLPEGILVALGQHPFQPIAPTANHQTYNTPVFSLPNKLQQEYFNTTQHTNNDILIELEHQRHNLINQIAENHDIRLQDKRNALQTTKLIFESPTILSCLTESTPIDTDMYINYVMQHQIPVSYPPTTTSNNINNLINNDCQTDLNQQNSSFYQLDNMKHVTQQTEFPVIPSSIPQSNQSCQTENLTQLIETPIMPSNIQKSNQSFQTELCDSFTTSSYTTSSSIHQSSLHTTMLDSNTSYAYHPSSHTILTHNIKLYNNDPLIYTNQYTFPINIPNINIPTTQCSNSYKQYYNITPYYKKI